MKRISMTERGDEDGILFYGNRQQLICCQTVFGSPVSIPQIMRGSQRRFSDSTIGIVCPVFAGQPPKMVVRFLEESEFETEYFYMILTYGHDESDLPEFTARLAEKHGVFVDYIAAIKMVDNYLPVFDMTEETALNKHIEEQMEAAVRAVSERKHGVPKATKPDYGKGELRWMWNLRESMSHRKFLCGRWAGETETGNLRVLSGLCA